MRAIFLLVLFVISNSLGLIAQKNNYKISCPPIDKMELATQFVPVNVNAPTYRLQFTPTSGFKTRLQGYTNYLYSFYPGLQGFKQTWQIFNAGTEALPIATSMVNIVPRTDGFGLADCSTEFLPNNGGEINM